MLTVDTAALVAALRNPGRWGNNEEEGEPGRLVAPLVLGRIPLDREWDGLRKLSGTVSLLEEACDVVKRSSLVVRVMPGSGADRMDRWDMVVEKEEERIETKRGW